ncbi:hypothetical protein LR066_02270 [candidate division WOR-3 bacterium]|nr:hypothetical protein [candidate division WOR-3 bacterium]
MMRPLIYILIVFGIFALSFLYLYQHAVTVELTFRLNERKKEITYIENKIEKLRVNIAHLTSWPRIKRIADKKGFIYPERIVVRGKE